MNWIVAASASALAYAAWALLLRVGITRYGWAPVLVGASAAEMLAILAITVPSLGPAVTVQSLGFGVLAGLCAAAGYLLFVAALSGVTHSLPVLVMSMYPAIVLVIGAVFMRQTMTWDRWLGVALAAVATWLVVR